MFNKLCVICLSACIAVGMVLGVTAHYSSDNDQDNITMCILEAKKELY